MLILVIFSAALVGRAVGQTGRVAPSQCVDDSDVYHSTYHAPQRAVPFPRVDPQIKRGFLELFHRETNPTHSHGNPHDVVTPEICQPSVIDPAIIAQINDLCPRDAFFYSFAPRHVNATMILLQQFRNLSSPAEVLRVSKALLNRHELNPRVWYYALLGTFIQRPDLNGYLLAWSVDATPDVYLPNSVLNLATEGSSRVQPPISSRQCTTSIGVQVTAQQYPLPGGNSTQQQQEQQQQDACQANATRTTGNQQQESIQNLNFSPVNNRQPGINQNLNFSPVNNRQPGINQNINFNPNNNRQSTQASYTTYINYPSYDAPQSPTYQQYTQGGQYSYRKKRQANQRCVLYNGTAGATGAENLLWYFREDMMVNEHHWYWHQYHPQITVRHHHRRGEQFYFTHHNIIARYNAERLSNGLPLVVPIDLRTGGNIGEGYDSDLVDSASGRFWTPRVANVPLNDVLHMQDRDFQLDATMADISGLYANLSSHIAQGILLANRSNNIFQLNIRNQEGLSHLANTIEASEELSTHAQFYHRYGVHNLGHIAIGVSTDPDFRCQLPTGVMADLTVTFRDPAFYKLHSLVDVMFHQYKSTLGPYQVQDGEWPLRWDGVKINSFEVLSGTQSNYLQTFWSVRRFPLEEGIDGSIHDGDVRSDICHQHLNHEPFTFRLNVDVDSCARTVSRRGTVRIFMAPRYDLDGRRFTMDETRKLMFQLDEFPVDLHRGRNTITRNSQDSSSTRPWSRTLQDMLRDPDNGGQTEYCGCGWPNHLYIPKGSPQGMQFDIFAIITNFDQDEVQNTAEDLRIQEPCNSPHLFCGVPYRRYPDARPMGYPFDREPFSVLERGQTVRPVRDLEEYVANVGNTKSAVVAVHHFDTIVS